MITKLLVSIFLVATLIGCNASHGVLHSDLTVQPSKQFELGGNQKGAFTVQARNLGQVAVSLYERQTDGHTMTLGTFAPGDAQTIRFAAGSAVLVVNRSDKAARLDLSVTGDKANLTMRERSPQHP